MEPKQTPESAYTLGYDDELIAKLGHRSAGHEGAFIAPFLTPTAQVLDLGCGPGTITVGLARAVASGKVIGIDIEPGQVEAASRLARAQGLDNAAFMVSDAAELPFEDACFDLVFAHTLFMHIERPRAVLQEIHRVCKPGGVLGIRGGLGTFEHFTRSIVSARFETLAELSRAIMRASGGDPGIGVRLKGLLHEAGFEVLRVGSSSTVYETPAELERLAAWSCGLYRGRFGELAVSQGLLTREELAQTIDVIDGWATDPAAISIVNWIEYVAMKPARA